MLVFEEGGKLENPAKNPRSSHENQQHRGTKRLVSVNIFSVEANSADIFVSKVPTGIFVAKVK